MTRYWLGSQAAPHPGPPDETVASGSRAGSRGQGVGSGQTCPVGPWVRGGPCRWGPAARSPPGAAAAGERCRAAGPSASGRPLSSAGRYRTVPRNLGAGGRRGVLQSPSRPRRRRWQPAGMSGCPCITEAGETTDAGAASRRPESQRRRCDDGSGRCGGRGRARRPGQDASWRAGPVGLPAGTAGSTGGAGLVAGGTDGSGAGPPAPAGVGAGVGGRMAWGPGPGRSREGMESAAGSVRDRAPARSRAGAGSGAGAARAGSSTGQGVGSERVGVRRGGRRSRQGPWVRAPETGAGTADSGGGAGVGGAGLGGRGRFAVGGRDRNSAQGFRGVGRQRQ